MNELAEYGPQWLVSGVVVIAIVAYTGRVLSEGSESWAKVFGPLGRRWRSRGLRRQEQRFAERDIRDIDLESRDRTIGYLSMQLDTCLDAHGPKDAFIEYDAKWHRDIRLRAIDAGCDLEPHIAFREFRDSFKGAAS